METVDDWEETRPPPEWLVDLGFRMDQVPLEDTDIRYLTPEGANFDQWLGEEEKEHPEWVRSTDAAAVIMVEKGKGKSGK